MATAREHFTINRAMEYFTEAELVKQMGTPMGKWRITLVKELIDNCLDAAESAGVDPEVTISIDENSMSIQDNGPGISEQVIIDSMNYDVRVSDKQGYVSPSRGQQGNALMCLYAVPFVLNGDHAFIQILTNGNGYDIKVTLNRIAKKPEVTTEVSKSEFIEIGTFIKIHDFDLACSQTFSKPRNSTKINFMDLISLFSCCNPHAKFILVFDGETIISPRNGKQVKWSTNMPLVCHWYRGDQFINLLASFIHRNQDMKVNDFLKLFDGLKASPKQKQVCDDIGISSREGIIQFVSDGDINRPLVNSLLTSMQKTARIIKPVKLGTLNVDHVKEIWAEHNHKLFEYRTSKGVTHYGLPYTLDVFFQISDGLSYRSPEICLNNSVLIDGDIQSNDFLLQGTYIDIDDKVKLLIHITCPSFNFSGKGKNKVILADTIFYDLKAKIATVSKKWTALKKKQRRDRIAKINELSKPEIKVKPMTTRAAAFQGMEAAYMKASTGNTLPANFRQVYYAARPDILRLSEIDELGDDYFRTLVREFQDENPDLTESWDIVFDARGNLIEPFTQERVPLGTLAVRKYMQGWGEVEISGGGAFYSPGIAKSNIFINGHKGKYKFALYIEKEGFESLITKTQIQERYGIALLSTKGMSPTAARTLIERLSDEGVTTFALHDFDKAGFTIAKILSHDTDIYKFKSDDVKVIDIGLRLEDIAGLEREPVKYSEKNNPKKSIIESGATPEEADILVQGGMPKKWHGERVELNAMTSGQLVELIESKLEAYGVKKVIPDDGFLNDAYRQIKAVNMKDKALKKIMEKYMPEIKKELSRYEAPEINIPEDLRIMVRNRITGNTKPWERALIEIS